MSSRTSKDCPTSGESDGFLDQLNRHFYDRHAASFGATRQSAWPGWQRVAEQVRASTSDRSRQRPTHVLDVACGNGRLFELLKREFDEEDLHYIGLDRSLPLLLERAAPADQEAQPTGSSSPGLRRSSRVWADGRLPPVRWHSMNLVTVFGLLHHLESEGDRTRLIDALRPLVVDRGVLALSFWQFADEPSIVRRALPWPQDRPRLPGDHLLPWGPRDTTTGAVAPSSVRFCHSTATEEIDRHEQRLLASGWTLLDRFRSDGRSNRLNHYLLLQRHRPTFEEGDTAPGT